MENKVKRLLKADKIEEYIISVCLHNKQALAKAMNSLVGVRDFTKKQNREAFAMIEMRYEKGKSLDPVVVMDTWIDMKIFSPAQAKSVASAYEGDTNYEPKINELAELGGKRKAKSDIENLWELSQTNIETAELAQKARKQAQAWITGSHKKYYTGAEIEEMAANDKIGQKLNQGIPLLDEVVYKNAGQHKQTVKATIFREKHGKTRHACWETAHDLRQGRKVLYTTLEGSARDIVGNLKQILQDEWPKYRDNIYLRDGTVNADEIEATIVDAVFTHEIDKVVIDYLHIMEQSDRRFLNENTNSNRCCQQMTRLAVKHDFNLHILNQARQAENKVKGYEKVPSVYDCYGSNQLIKDASIILVGVRPRNHESLLTKDTVPPYKHKVRGPKGRNAPLNSVFVKPILSRQKLDCQHKWLHFVDTDEGLKLYKNELI